MTNVIDLATRRPDEPSQAEFERLFKPLNPAQRRDFIDWCRCMPRQPVRADLWRGPKAIAEALVAFQTRPQD